MDTVIYRAKDISCEGCANSIRRALGRLEGVGDVHVEVATKMVTVQYSSPASPDSIARALENAGFPVDE